MDSKTNVTYITLGGTMEMEKYRYVYFIMMFIVYILIISSNSTIICLIIIHKNLHEPMYIFIATLLLNSLFYSTTIYPKLLIDILSDQQVIRYSACLFQCFLYYTLNASEFLLLAAMAFDRYVSICKPLQYTTIMRKLTVNVIIGLVWILPACQISVPVIVAANAKLCSFILQSIFCNNSIYNLHCVVSQAMSIYGVIMLINVTVIPILFILFTYAKIFVISYRSSGEMKKKAAQTCLPHLLVLVNYFCLITYDVTIIKLESEIPKMVRFILTLQIILYHPLFNPIIYGLKMKEITKHLKNLLCKDNLNRC